MYLKLNLKEIKCLKLKVKDYILMEELTRLMETPQLTATKNCNNEIKWESVYMRFADHQIQNAQVFTAIVQQSRSLAQQRKGNVQQKNF